ncbi:MAG: hypothetical protein ACYDBB_18050 [Armatimonadota bacterium]
MKQMWTLGVAALVLALAGTAFAYPTLTGPTGLTIIPTGYIGNSGFTVAGDYQKFESGFGVPVRATIGLGNTWEVGALYDFLDEDTGLDRAFGANTKFRIGRFLGGDGAIGAQFIRVESVFDFETDFEQAYFAWSGNFGSAETINFGITWGVNWTRISPDIGDSEDAFRLFAGAEVAILRSFTLLAEYQTDEEDLGETDPITSVALRYCTGQNWAAQVGITNAFQLIGTDDHDWFAGIALNLGGRGE